MDDVADRVIDAVGRDVWVNLPVCAETVYVVKSARLVAPARTLARLGPISDAVIVQFGEAIRFLIAEGLVSARLSGTTYGRPMVWFCGGPVGGAPVWIGFDPGDIPPRLRWHRFDPNGAFSSSTFARPALCGAEMPVWRARERADLDAEVQANACPLCMAHFKAGTTANPPAVATPILSQMLHSAHSVDALNARLGFDGFVPDGNVVTAAWPER